MWLALIPGFLLLAAAAPVVCRRLGSRSGWVFAAPAAAAALGTLAAIPGAGEPASRPSLPWVPSLGLSYTLLPDGLALLFASLVTGVGALIFVYAGEYLKGHPDLGRFFAILILFLAAMVGVALAGNLLLLFVFWELTSLASWLLIGFDHHRESACKAALQAFLVTAGGGLALLAGLLLLGAAAGSFELAEVLARGDRVREHPHYVPILILVLLGAFTKSAQFPFHFWLPRAMEAPTPVSAYLHSATMVKAGVFLLARLLPVLGGRVEWFIALSVVGSLTALLGGWLALLQTDLKRVLAYSTVSALGLMTALLGSADALPLARAALAFLLAHALYKGALFLVAGILDHELGTRDLRRMGGLRSRMPRTAAASFAAALSMAAVLPAFGFVAKELILETALGSSRTWLLTLLTVVSGMSFAAVAGLAGLGPFAGKVRATEHPAHDPPAALLLAPALLGAVGIGLGLFPATAGAGLAVAAQALAGPGDLGPLGLWHGLTPALGLSALSLLGGAGLYALAPRLRPLALRGAPLLRWGPGEAYERSLRWLVSGARAQTRLLQSGRLGTYLFCILATLVVVSLRPWVASHPWALSAAAFGGVRFYEGALAILILLGAVAAVRSPSLFGAIASLGIVGYGVALLFVLFGAPDLAMTQFLVETLTVILFVFVFYRLADSTVWVPPGPRYRDLFLGIVVGGLMASFVLIANGLDRPEPVSGYFLENSLPAAHGRNVVNVILVDFRALDTLGEVTVLTVAAIGVYGLVRFRASREVLR